MSLETNNLICFENTKSMTKQLEIVFKCSENLIGAAITLNHTLQPERLAVKCKAWIPIFLSYGDILVIEKLEVTPKDILNSRTDFLWFHQHYTSNWL